MALSVTESMLQQESAMGSELYSTNRGPIELIPNPDFVFPARSDHASSRRTQSSSIARRPRSEQNLSSPASAPMHRNRASVSALPLPSFSFNPTGTSSAPTSVVSTPPLSPSLNPPSTPSRSRHRRGGSELIGGDCATGSVNIISSSPQQLEFPPSAATLHLGPPAGRRHAHRRSGAISCHDLASIMQSKESNAQARSGSAPTSPLDIDVKAFNFPAQPRRSSDQSISRASIDETLIEDATQRRPPSRARVGFADRIEYIRPLSTISSETESSMSTIRGHSVSGSWSSVVSNTNPSPARMARPSLNTTFEDDDSKRPSTSQATLTSPNSTRFSFGLEPTIEERPRSEAGLPSSPSRLAELQPKRKSFGWWESKAKRTQLEPSQALSHPGEIEALSPVSPPTSPKATRHSLDSDQETIKCAMAGSERKKPRKVRSWAHSLISRKSKSKKDYRPATPPASSAEQSDDTDKDSTSSLSDNEQPNFDFNFDEDNTVTIINETAQQPILQIETMCVKSNPADIVSPVIDLDAALSPFNAQFNQIARGSRQVRSRRSMHSSSLTSGAFQLASQHRRTESAPELVPFELRSTTTFAPSVMPDVFEEEDEELAAEEDAKLSSGPESCADDDEEVDGSTDIRVVEVDQSALAQGPWPSVAGFGSMRRKKSEGLSIDTGSRPGSVVLDNPEAAQQIVSQPQPTIAIEVVEDEVRDSQLADDPMPTPLSESKFNMHSTLHYAIPLPPQNIMTPDTVSDTSTYSPFFSPSQASFDGNRLDTGASSLNDTPSFVFGEPGPEVRVSVDDVPSLSSSRSTMTSPPVHIGMPGSSVRTRSVYSSHSTTTVDFTAQKRGSIASLSRLVAAGLERSKLSIETRPMTSQENMTMTPKRVKQRHRLSKLMQFWRSKESA